MLKVSCVGGPSSSTSSSSSPVVRRLAGGFDLHPDVASKNPAAFAASVLARWEHIFR